MHVLWPFHPSLESKLALAGLSKEPCSFWDGSLLGALGLTGGGWTPNTVDAIVDSAPGTPPLKESNSLQLLRESQLADQGQGGVAGSC